MYLCLYACINMVCLLNGFQCACNYVTQRLKAVLKYFLIKQIYSKIFISL